MSNSATDLPSSIARKGANAPVSLVRSLQAASFWIAVVLPFLYVPLVFTGLDGGPTTTAFAVLLAANVLALLLGHPHLDD